MNEWEYFLNERLEWMIIIKNEGTEWLNKKIFYKHISEYRNNYIGWYMTEDKLWWLYAYFSLVLSFWNCEWRAGIGWLGQINNECYMFGLDLVLLHLISFSLVSVSNIIVWVIQLASKGIVKYRWRKLICLIFGLGYCFAYLGSIVLSGVSLGPIIGLGHQRFDILISSFIW